MIEQLNLIAPGATGVQKMPTEPIVREAEIEGDCRFSLKRAWGAGPCILWCGLNPSKADAKRDDPTMLREIGFSYRWGFGSLIKINIYPFISSSTKELANWRKKLSHPGPARGSFILNGSRSRLHIRGCTEFVAAWGNGAAEEDLRDFLEMTTQWEDGSQDGLPAEIPVQWKCLGTTQDGSPKHTLARGLHRIPDDAQLQPWRPKFNRIGE